MTFPLIRAHTHACTRVYEVLSAPCPLSLSGPPFSHLLPVDLPTSIPFVDIKWSPRVPPFPHSFAPPFPLLFLLLYCLVYPAFVFLRPRPWWSLLDRHGFLVHPIIDSMSTSATLTTAHTKILLPHNSFPLSPRVNVLACLGCGKRVEPRIYIYIYICRQEVEISCTFARMGELRTPVSRECLCLCQRVFVHLRTIPVCVHLAGLLDGFLQLPPATFRRGLPSLLFH